MQVHEEAGVGTGFFVGMVASGGAAGRHPSLTRGLEFVQVNGRPCAGMAKAALMKQLREPPTVALELWTPEPAVARERLVALFEHADVGDGVAGIYGDGGETGGNDRLDATEMKFRLSVAGIEAAIGRPLSQVVPEVDATSLPDQAAMQQLWQHLARRAGERQVSQETFVAGLLAGLSVLPVPPLAKPAVAAEPRGVLASVVATEPAVEAGAAAEPQGVLASVVATEPAVEAGAAAEFQAREVRAMAALRGAVPPAIVDDHEGDSDDLDREMVARATALRTSKAEKARRRLEQQADRAEQLQQRLLAKQVAAAEKTAAKAAAKAVAEAEASRPRTPPPPAPDGLEETVLVSVRRSAPGEGLGLGLGEDEHGVLVTSVRAGSPAADARAIVQGQYVVGLNGDDVAAWSGAEIATAIRQYAGTELELELRGGVRRGTTLARLISGNARSLPFGWRALRAPGGRLYFVDDTRRLTTFHDPRV